MILNPADVIAALQMWTASASGGSATAPHQMNATVNPIFGGDGSITIRLNF